MRTSDALSQLTSHQADVLAKIDEACELVLRHPLHAQPELARTRWELVRKLKAYQVFKHGGIFDPAIASGSPAQVAAARHMKAECVAAGEAYRAYTLRWSGSDVVSVWSSYKEAMLKMAATLREHIARERRQIPALLAGAERTRHLADAHATHSIPPSRLGQAAVVTA